MELSQDLGVWTYETIEELVDTREYEPEEFDYKAFLESPNPIRGEKDKHNHTVRKAACALANTNGGFIIFGVKDRGTEVAQRKDRIVGITLGGDIRADFGRKLEGVRPNISFDALPEAIKLPNNQEKGIFVVRTPQSIRRPHMVLSDSVCYRRDAGGSSVAMDIYQIRDLVMLTQDRLRRAELLCDELRSTHKIATNMIENWNRGADSVLFQRFRTATIQGLMADVMALPISDEFQVDLPQLLRGVSTYNDYLQGYTTITTASTGQRQTLRGCCTAYSRRGRSAWTRLKQMRAQPRSRSA